MPSQQPHPVLLFFKTKADPDPTTIVAIDVGVVEGRQCNACVVQNGTIVFWGWHDGEYWHCQIMPDIDQAIGKLLEFGKRGLVN